MTCKYADMKELQKTIKAEIKEIQSRFGIETEPMVNIGGHLSGTSEIETTIRLIKPDHMCPRDDYRYYYDEAGERLDEAKHMWDDIHDNQQWTPIAHYDAPIREELRPMLDKVIALTDAHCQEHFEKYNNWVDVIFKSQDELG